jgi:hypothetical protein
MNDLINIVKSYAPALATALATGPTGLVVSAIAGKLGVSADVVAITQAIAQDPKAAQKLAEIDLEQFKVEVEDRKSAREMQIATRSYFVPSLGFFIVGSFIGVIVATLLGWATADSVLAGTLIGYLSGKAEQVISFYFGSSHGSQAKDQLLFNSEPKK